MNRIYHCYKIGLFERLTAEHGLNIPIHDKRLICELLKKPWNPYIRRHSALTEKSKILKEHVLRQHAGWSGRSQMHLKYLHYFGNESSESILEAYGLKTKIEEINKLKPIGCPNCSDANKVDSKFCSKCRMILNYDAYTETLEQKQSEVKMLTEKYDKGMKEMQAQMNYIVSLIQENPKLAKLKTEVLNQI